MNRLLEIGFEVAGHWSFEGPHLRCELIRHSTQENILYAFVSDGAVQYIGKTSGTLRRRMSGYARPHEGQGTNWRNNARIKTLLEAGAAVDIFALPDSGLMHYGQFHLNLAAGLEDSLIRVMNPPWNSGAKEKSTLAAIDDEAPQAPGALESTELIGGRFTFAQSLAATYREHGFFNVAVAHQSAIGADGEKIEIYLGDAESPTLGTISRRANANATPRIMGGADLKRWFHKLGQVETIRVEVLSPTTLRLRAD